MNMEVHSGRIGTASCAYLHNYRKAAPEPLLGRQYRRVVEDTPVFFKTDTRLLQEFIRKYVGGGNGRQVLYDVENGRIIPSKKFVEYVSDLFRGNPVYTLLDEQKIAYATIIDLASGAEGKTVMIVNGGPGTGKSVVAMNAFVALLERKLNARFVAPNASFRETMVDMLGRHTAERKKRLKVLFSGSGGFVDAAENDFDVLICDEAHRLKKKGAFMYRGESQIEDVVKAARVSVFFIDDRQAVRPDDEGTVERVQEVAAKYGCAVHTVELQAQFRCSGAEGYLNWVDHTLQLADTANFDGWDTGAFDFRLYDDPNELRAEISRRNDEGFRARMLAGYAWPWTKAENGNDNAQAADVAIPEYGFAMPWNSRKNTMLWAVDDSMCGQVGCIHTAQGLEFDYVGVLVGNDLRFDPDRMEVRGDYRNYFDGTGKKGLREEPERLTAYIRNIYRVLLTRGMKGCYVFCRDPALREYVRERMPAGLPGKRR